MGTDEHAGAAMSVGRELGLALWIALRILAVLALARPGAWFYYQGF